tara:strand:+ start:571 stop:696 length:126 start_codon:yes stop_codon:yes gene_type:complete
MSGRAWFFIQASADTLSKKQVMQLKRIVRHAIPGDWLSSTK